MQERYAQRSLSKVEQQRLVEILSTGIERQLKKARDVDFPAGVSVHADASEEGNE
jgi:hypothetical protein